MKSFIEKNKETIKKFKKVGKVVKDVVIFVGNAIRIYQFFD
ncbi:hypothetical protein QNH49_22565 [Bacillus bombysepticus]|nr:hypothetical protein QNH49_22565 [Bacillus bombysepticus]